MENASVLRAKFKSVAQPQIDKKIIAYNLLWQSKSFILYVQWVLLNTVFVVVVAVAGDFYIFYIFKSSLCVCVFKYLVVWEVRNRSFHILVLKAPLLLDSFLHGGEVCVWNTGLQLTIF